MSETKITHPHDRLFKRSMQQIKIAIDLFRSCLPPALVNDIDWSTLTLINSEYLLQGLEKLQSDCVYSCKIRGEEGYIIFASEHQSTEKAMMSYRMLRYGVTIMDQHLAQGHQKLPIVLPIVMYHGTVSPYPYSCEIWDCFSHPELAKQWALKPFQLIDLTVLSDEEIEQHGLANVLEMLLKHSRQERVLGWLKKMIAAGKLTIIYSEIGPDYVRDVGKYIIKACGDEKYPEERDQAIALLASAVPEVGEDIMTFAQQFKQEGIRQGMQQGMQQGVQQEKHEIAKRLLERGMSPEDIVQITGLAKKELKALH